LTPEEKRKKKLKEKAKRGKVEAAATKARQEVKMRASAKRVRKGNKPGKLGAGAEEKKQFHSKKMKMKKGRR